MGRAAVAQADATDPVQPRQGADTFDAAWRGHTGEMARGVIALVAVATTSRRSPPRLEQACPVPATVHGTGFHRHEHG
jgi:hypothetical protein